MVEVAPIPTANVSAPATAGMTAGGTTGGSTTGGGATGGGTTGGGATGGIGATGGGVTGGGITGGGATGSGGKGGGGKGGGNPGVPAESRKMDKRAVPSTVKAAHASKSDLLYSDPQNPNILKHPNSVKEVTFCLVSSS